MILRNKPDFSDLDEIPNVFPSTNDSGDESLIEDIQAPPDSNNNPKGNEKKVNYASNSTGNILKYKNGSSSLPPIDKHKDSILTDDRLQINLSSNKMSFLELHHILDETNRKRYKPKAPPVKKIIDDNYDELQNPNSYEEESDVKELEKWHLEMKKRNIVQLNERNDIFKSPNKKPSFNSYEPHVNTELVNRILYDSDEEKEKKKFVKDKLSNYQQTEENEEVPQPGGQTSKFKGLENAMKETNLEILDEMIIKKIKHLASTIDMEKQTEEQMKYQVKKITEDIVRHFSSLKSVESVTLLHTHIESIIKKLKKKKVEIAKTFSFKDQKSETDNNKLVDYKTTEIVHIKNYEQIVEEMNSLRSQLQNAASHLSTIKGEINQKHRQLDGIRKKLQSLEEENPKRYEEKPGKTNIERKLNTPNSSVEEYIKIQKIKYELKKQESEIIEQVEAQEKLLSQFAAEAEKIEAKLRTAKDLKAHTRMKLKELYLRILKDETELIQSTTCSSYSWVLRALWKIGDDASDPSLFPTFLDRENIEFLVSYARAQADLEDHCRRYNLQGFTSGMDDFKHLEIMDAKNYQVTETTKESLLPPISKFQEKDRESLLSDVKSRMQDMKRANLKAKRLIHLAQYGPKGKQIIEKWEEVNPAESANLPLVDVNGQYYVPQRSFEGLNQSIEKEESKLIESIVPKIKSKNSNPLEKANDLLMRVETLSTNELNRIIKTNVNRDFDDQAKYNLQKTLKYLFGKKESDDYFAKFLREKRVHDIKLNKVSKITAKKSDSLKLSGLNLRHSTHDLSKNYTLDTGRKDHGNSSMEFLLDKEGSSILSASPLKNSSINKSSPYFDMKAVPSKKSQFTEQGFDDSMNRKLEVRESQTVR